MCRLSDTNLIDHISSALKWPPSDWIAVQCLARHLDFCLRHHIQNGSWFYPASYLTGNRKSFSGVCLYWTRRFSTVFTSPSWAHSGLSTSSELDFIRLILCPVCTPGIQNCECILGKWSSCILLFSVNMFWSILQGTVWWRAQLGWLHHDSVIGTAATLWGTWFLLPHTTCTACRWERWKC